MTTELVSGPAILVGYAYALQLSAETPLFPEAARFAGQLRHVLSDPEPITTLTSVSGGLVRISDTVLEVRLAPEITSRLVPGSVLLDLVRTDLAPPQHLALFLELPVLLPVTRDLSP